jgi:hypothetical protein
MTTVVFRAVWWGHILVGVPVAAFEHSILQFAYASTGGPISQDLWLFPLHFLSGVIVGSIVLVPAFSLQALLFRFLARRGAPALLIVAACGAFQAGLVAFWADTVGIEPSLAGRFRLTPPMIVAGFIAGACATLAAATVLARRQKWGPGSPE